MIVPGRTGVSIAGELLPQLKNAVFLDSSAERLSSGARVACVRGQATRLPFARHSFNAVLSFEALYSIRPPWTVLAEFHRVLVPNGNLVLLEPARHGVFSALRDKVAGPGKRVFDLEEVRRRLVRGDYEIQKIEGPQPLSGMPFPAWCVLANKIEFAAEPAPSFHTAKELIEKRKQRTGTSPSNDELPESV
ncbi:MAG TPA: methyltransferase domain-containing protein [Planctomycetota bacterium]|nr:methyltransferase domain-containing protein [Planctomycetota bacterium]